MTILSRALAFWLLLSCLICGVFLFSCWAVQQNYRLGFNAPQLQLAEDGAAQVGAGGAPAALTRDRPSVDLRTSLAAWVAVYDASGTPLESTGILDGTPPQLPPGVFDSRTWRKHITGYDSTTSGYTETFFTWQPRSDVRQAVALVALGNGEFVAAGRNMRYVESNIATLSYGALFAWGATELGTLAVLVLLLALGWL